MEIITEILIIYLHQVCVFSYMYFHKTKTVTCNPHSSECVTQKHAHCDAGMLVTPGGGTKSHACHHLHVNVLLRIIYHHKWLKKVVYSFFIVTCNAHNSECATQKHAHCDAAMLVTPDASDQMVGLSHMLVIICMSLY